MFSFINLIISGSTEDDYLLTLVPLRCHKKIIHNSTKPSQRRLQNFKGSERSLTSQALILTKICDESSLKASPRACSAVNMNISVSTAFALFWSQL